MRRLGQHQAAKPPERQAGLHPLPVSLMRASWSASPIAEALPRGRHRLREARGQLPQTRSRTHRMRRRTVGGWAPTAQTLRVFFALSALGAPTRGSLVLSVFAGTDARTMTCGIRKRQRRWRAKCPVDGCSPSTPHQLHGP